jgi:hypothetical protein
MNQQAPGTLVTTNIQEFQVNTMNNHQSITPTLIPPIKDLPLRLPLPPARLPTK